MKRLNPNILFNSDYLNCDLARKSVRGGMITMSSQGIQLVLQIASTVVLARLLTPADYGLVGMVTVVMNFASIFKDAGLSIATVQKEEITNEQISTLFWLNIIISASLGLCLILAGAPLVAWFYGNPELSAITAALSFAFIFSGLTIQHQALQVRHMRFAMLAGIQIASQVISLIVTIIMAYLGMRYWALVCGTLVNALISSLLTFIFCPWVPGWMQRGTDIREMLKFGGHLTGFNFINYFSRNADNILIGRFISADALGLYSRAYSLFMMPINQIRGPMSQVAMPVLSSLRNEPDRYVKYYERLLDIMATLAMPLTIYCAIEAEFLIRLLLGPQWLGAVPVFRILAIVGLVQTISGTRGLVMISNGYSGRNLVFGIVNGSLTVVSFIAGLPFGIEGVALAYTIMNYAVLIPSLFYCFNGTPVRVSLFLKALVLPFFLSILAAVLAIFASSTWMADAFPRHYLFGALFILIYGVLSSFRKSMQEAYGFFGLRGSAWTRD
jgi:O-antigen/teichoic acid export membrane protein